MWKRFLTTLNSVIAGITDSGRLPAPVFERCCVGRTGGADHLAARPAVVAPDQHGELERALLAHGHPSVGDPNRGDLAWNQSLDLKPALK